MSSYNATNSYKSEIVPDKRFSYLINMLTTKQLTIAMFYCTAMVPCL